MGRKPTINNFYSQHLLNFVEMIFRLTKAVYSDPTWMNHKDIFEKAGFTKVQSYRYWDTKTARSGLRFTKLTIVYSDQLLGAYVP